MGPPRDGFLSFSENCVCAPRSRFGWIRGVDVDETEIYGRPNVSNLETNAARARLSFYDLILI